MKKALFKDTFRQVAATRGRFFSILAIIALGCGFFAGLKVTSSDMKITAEKYFNDQNLADLRIISTLGIRDEDIAAIEAESGIKASTKGYSADFFANSKTKTDMIIKTFSMPLSSDENFDKLINKPLLESGRFPEKSNECLAEENPHFPNTFEIGDTVSFATNDTDRPIEDILSITEFTVVGTISSPTFVSFDRGSSPIGNGSADIFMYLPEEAYSSEYFTDVYLTFDSLDGVYPFSDEYKDAAKEKIDQFEVVGEKRVAELTSTMQTEFDDKKAEYIDGKTEYNDSLKKFTTEISDAEKKISDGEKAISDAKKTYADGLNQYNSGLEKWNAEGAASLEKLNSAALQLTTAGMPISPEISGGIATLNQQKSILDQTAETLEKANAEIQKNAADLAAAKKELTDQKSDGQKKLDDAKADLDDASKKLSDASSVLSKAIENAQWFVLDRTANIGYSTYEVDADRVDSIAKVFPIFFILVAGLVCLTTMTRMVEEQRTQIGTLKALGYSKMSIMGQYLIYSLVASITGGFLGLVVGFKVFPIVIYSAYNLMYNMPPIIAPFRWDYAIVCITAAILCTGLSSLAACYTELISLPASLMRPKPPKNGKRVFLERITFLWKHFSFNAKVTCRNIFRYKSRVLMTIVGIAGCTALLLTGFGLKYSISSIVDKQYGEIFNYDVIVAFDDAAKSKDKIALNNIIEDTKSLTSGIYTRQEKIDATANDVTQDATLFVPEKPENLSALITLKTHETQKPIPLTDDGVVINEKLATLLDLKVGDFIDLTDAKSPIKVTGITENYTFNYVYITPKVYLDNFGELNYNSYMAKTLDGSDSDETSASLLKSEAVLSVNFTSSANQQFQDLVKSLDLIVVVIIVCAGALAFVVLYNLANININERIRELATIKVLGFYDGEVSAYIYRENTISSLLGMAVGLVLGIFLESFVVATAEVDVVMFSRDIPFSSFFFAGLLTLFFTVVVNLLLHFKLKKIDMAASMKAIE